jgi:hypothetical protein
MTTLINRKPEPREMGRGRKIKGERRGIQFDELDQARLNEIQSLRKDEAGGRELGITQLVREALWCYLKELRKGSKRG